MPAHPKFNGEYIDDKTHERCVARMGSLWRRLVVPAIDGLDLHLRGRWQKPDAPCFYVFRHKELYETESRSRFLHIQDNGNSNAIEVVFRKIRDFEPLSTSDWRRLVSEKYQPNEAKWRAFVVYNEATVETARELINKAIGSYDSHFGIPELKVSETE